METENMKIASVDNNLRLCVIENAIFIEELSSRVLGTILNIEWEKSKSFGNASGALSFNQKLQLIQDIKGIDKEDVKKVICISNIRNKFAHVSAINTFEIFFSSSSVGKEVHAQLIKWYFDDKGTSDIHSTKLELIYRYCFYLLVNDVINILLKISDEHSYNQGFQDGRQSIIENFMKALLDSLKARNLYSIIKEALQEVDKTTNLLEE